MIRECQQGNDIEDSYLHEYVYIFALTIVLHRGMYAFLSLFESTRCMVKMVLECISSMVPFAIVTFGLMGVLAVSYF